MTAAECCDGPGTAVLLAGLLAQMPDPVSAAHAAAFEAELAGWFGTRHAVAVSSGTAALHTALAALGIGDGDEVLLPAVSVVMSAAPVVYTGARPVFADCAPDGDIDYRDLDAKLSRATRAILPVHLWGRASDMPRLMRFAARRGLHVVEDACQAYGTVVGGRLAGTFGDIGCFSLKDGKILSCGEGGFLLTNDDRAAANARAFRTHWQAPPPGQAALARLGCNYRLAEPLAVIARGNLSRIEHLLAQRAHQALLLASLLDQTPGLQAAVHPGDRWNGHAPLFRVTLPRPRAFCERLARAGVPNSVGTFGLVPAGQQPAFSAYRPATCPAAARLIDTTLAVVVTARDSDERIRAFADLIDREARQWLST
ncbi:MAG TPA: aminotransferase class I/II-fold pyridoxal phosphate-dependent enzyme [Streptosporangiaceae bacterium]